MDKKHVQGLLAEQLTAQKYRLDQYTKDELIEIYTALNHVQDDILRRWGKSIKTEWSQTRAVGMLEEARGLMDEIKPKIEGSIASTLGKISEESAAVYSDMLTFGGKAKAAKAAMLSAEQMAAYWRTTPVGGHLLNDWVNRTFDGPTIEAIRREVFAGMFQGEGYPKMIRRLQDGFAMTRREAETLVRTYVHTANIHAMEEVYGKNRDVIAGVRWLTAFDERTCMRCAALSGKLYPLDDHPSCPLHPRCRCVLVPETDIKKLKVQPKVAKDWKDGLQTKVPDLDKVVTPDGIPRTDFRSWIMSRPEKDQLKFFGPVRYGMIKEGKIGWDDLFEEIVGLDGKENIRLRSITELLGERQTVHHAGKNDLDAVALVVGKHVEREARDLARHEKIRDALDERAFAKAMRDAARAATLFEAGNKVKAKTIGEKAIEKVLRYVDLFGEGYDFDGVVFRVIGEDGKSFMATELFRNIGTPGNPNWKRGGRIFLNDQPCKDGWVPVRGVLDALKKIHEGVSLTRIDEDSLHVLYHEITHTRQNWLLDNYLKGLPEEKKVLMEAINEWTARRNYREFLRKLGRESILSGDGLKTKAYGYTRRVSNFDALVDWLGITDEKKLEELRIGLTGINETNEVATFNKQVSKLLKGMAKTPDGKKLKWSIGTILMNLDAESSDFINIWLQWREQ